MISPAAIGVVDDNRFCDTTVQWGDILTTYTRIFNYAQFMSIVPPGWDSADQGKIMLAFPGLSSNTNLIVDKKGCIPHDISN
jgi:hypothetical protein